MALSRGTRLGPYEILAPLGAGGMGEVYRARDPRLGREVAIKVLPDAPEDTKRVQRLEREARAAGALNHPNILTIFEIGTDDSRTYVVSELLEGETLRERMAGEALPVAKAIEYGVQIAGGLCAAHDKGIVHRDLKPRNLFVTRDGLLKILDFGLAKLGAEVLREDQATATAEPLTEPGTVLGTVGYMSPEQLRGHAEGPRSDIFSFGVVLYEMLSGRRPFDRGTAADTMTAILREEPAGLGSGTQWAPPAVQHVLRRCLEKRPEDRYATSRELRAALESLSDASRAPAPARLPAAERVPYPGLAAFTEADAENFFGRESEVEALGRRLRSRQLLGLIGPSGAGKTSFLRAGLLPSLPEGWQALVCTPGDAPLAGLARALVAGFSGDIEALRQLVRLDAADVAVSLVTRWRKRHSEALLVVDQFEELFTLNPAEEQARFAHLLGRLVAEAGARVLLSMRDDFLIHCHDHEALAPIFSELTPLKAPAGAALRRALVEPASRQGFRFEDESLVDEMLAQVSGERGALPLLAFAASRLWERRDLERNLLTREAYRELGGVAGALAQHAEATLERIGVERQPLVREVFRNLVTAQGTRAARDREELLSVFPDQHEAAAGVIEGLLAARLLTSFEVEAAGEEAPRHRVEIVHESLVSAWPRLVRWHAQESDGAVLRDQLRQAAGLWDARDRPADLLWSGSAYREFQLWRERYPGGLTETEDSFAHAMAAQAGRRRRRRRLVATTVLTMAVSVAVVTATLWRRSETARARAVSEAQRAEASSLVALGRGEIDRYPSAALAYARRSLHVADTQAGRRLALDALWQGPTARVLPLKEGSWTGEFSPDGRWLATFPFSGNVMVFPDDGSAPTAFGGHGSTNWIPWIGFTPDSRALLTRRLRDTGVRMASLASRQELRWLAPELAGAGEGSVVFLWPLPQGLLFHHEAEGDSVGRLTLSPWDGGPSRVLGSFRDSPQQPVSWITIGGTPARLALARGTRVFVRPVAGPPTTPEREVARTRDATRALVLSTRRDSLAVQEANGRITVWPLAPGTRREPRVLSAEDPKNSYGPAFDPDGTRLAWGSNTQGIVYLWSLEGPPDAEPVALRRVGVPFTKQTTFNPAGDWLAVANTRSLTLWAVRQPQSVVLRGHETAVWHVFFTPDSKWLVSCGRQDRIRIWPLEPQLGAGRTIPLAGGLGNCNALAVAPGGQRLIVGGGGGAHVVPVWGGEPRRLMRMPPDGGPYGVAFDASGRLAAAASRISPGPPKKLRIWDLESGGPPREVPLIPPGEEGRGFDYGVGQLAFTPDGDLVAAGMRGIRRFDVEAGRSQWIWQLESNWHAVMALGRDGRHLLASARPEDEGSGGDNPVVFFDLAEGTSRSITSHGNRVMAVALDPSGQILVTGDALGAVRVGPADGSEPHLLLGHTEGVGRPGNRLAVSPDGRWIASAAGAEIRVWPMPDVTRPPLHELPLGELLAKLHELTNVRVVESDTSPTGYSVEIGPFPGWKDAPSWFTPAPEPAAASVPPDVG